jgi:hypothetical protein
MTTTMMPPVRMKLLQPSKESLLPMRVMVNLQQRQLQRVRLGAAVTHGHVHHWQHGVHCE